MRPATLVIAAGAGGRFAGAWQTGIGPRAGQPRAGGRRRRLTVVTPVTRRIGTRRR